MIVSAARLEERRRICAHMLLSNVKLFPRSYVRVNDSAWFVKR
jgi:hypothetical protein